MFCRLQKEEPSRTGQDHGQRLRQKDVVRKVQVRTSNQQVSIKNKEMEEGEGESQEPEGAAGPRSGTESPEKAVKGAVTLPAPGAAAPGTESMESTKKELLHIAPGHGFALVSLSPTLKKMKRQVQCKHIWCLESAPQLPATCPRPGEN